MEASDALATVGIGLLLSLSPTVASATPLDSKFHPESGLAASITVSAATEEPSASSRYTRLAQRMASPRLGSEAYDDQIRSMLSGEAIAPEGDVAAIASEAAPPIDIPVTEAIAPPESQPSVELSQQSTTPSTGVEGTPGSVIGPDTDQLLNLPPTTTDFLPEVETFVEDLEQYPIGEEVGFPDYIEPNPNPLYLPNFPEEVDLEGIQPITLQQAIALAERNNPELQSNRLELSQRRAELAEQRADLLPDVSLRSSLSASEGTQQEITNPFTGETTEQGNDVDVLFGADIRIDYNIFTSGLREAQINAAEEALRIQELQLESQAEQLRLQVTLDYYDLQQADEQLRIRRDALNQALQNLRDAQALERAGVGTRFDVLQAEVDVANRQQELVRSLSDQQVARRQLAQRISVDQDINLAAADPVAVTGDWDLTLPESIVLAYDNRSELEQQLVQRELAASRRRAAISQYGPQVGAFAQYEVQDVLSEEDTGLEDDWTIGLQLNWRLFDGGEARAQARQQEIAAQIAEANFSEARDQIRFEVEQAYFNLRANQTNISTAQLNVERAQESLRLARLRFQAGVGTQSDVLRAQTELTQAEFNLVEAVLGYNQSLARLRRAVSNWPNNNLGDRP